MRPLRNHAKQEMTRKLIKLVEDYQTNENAIHQGYDCELEQIELLNEIQFGCNQLGIDLDTAMSLYSEQTTDEDHYARYQ